MRHGGIILALACAVTSLSAQEKTEGPTCEKAQKTYNEGLGYLHQRAPGSALESFKKADKQDGGHCAACQQKMIKYGVELGDWKTAETAAGEIVAEAQGERNVALAHYEFGIVLMDEGLNKHKDEFFARAHDEMTKALAAYPKFPDAMFVDGRALAHLKQDDAAKAQFEQFVKMQPEDSPDRQRALRYISQPELARARMAPPFAVTTIDGQRISLDDLKGKGGPARFLGDLVPAVSRGSAACAGYREEVSGSALGGAEREPRHG
jgi:tetratricopeptide (TPR) repeat protein